MRCPATGFLQRGKGQRDALGIGLGGVGITEQLKTRLTEFTRAGRWRIGRAKAKCGAVVAVARGLGRVALAFEMQAAGRHGEVWAQAHFRAVEIGEDVGAAAQILADHIEKQPCRLQDRGRNQFATGVGEDRHHSLRLRFKCAELIG